MSPLATAAADAPAAPPRTAPRRGRKARLLSSLCAWFDRIEQRRQLAELSPHELADIGLTREEVAQALAKPFWRRAGDAA